MRIDDRRWAAPAVAALLMAGCGHSSDERLVEAYTAKAAGSFHTPLYLAAGAGNADAVAAVG